MSDPTFAMMFGALVMLVASLCVLRPAPQAEVQW